MNQGTMSLVGLTIFALAMGGLWLVHVVVTSVTYGGVVRRWAARHGFRLLRRRFAWSRGPFPTVSRYQRVMRIRVEAPDGCRRDGWALCGGRVQGSAVDCVEVQWDSA